MMPRPFESFPAHLIEGQVFADYAEGLADVRRPALNTLTAQLVARRPRLNYAARMKAFLKRYPRPCFGLFVCILRRREGGKCALNRA
jgi:hypothetical protein